MSANRTRLLLADDTDLLARARPGIVSRPEFDVVMAASTDEALQVMADAPPPAAIVLPADGSIDGLQVCRTAKTGSNGRPFVLLALPADGSARRDACFAAGADDVLFAPVEAADIAMRLDRGASGFRNAPRADVELVVRLANPSGSAVIDAKGMQISREAIAVQLPSGTSTPAGGMLVRTVFTLYDGGTLQVWARVAQSGADRRTVLRFVGLTEAERRAIDYFVDFYLKRTGATTAQGAPANGEPTSGSSAEELLMSASIPGQGAEHASSRPVAYGELIRQVAIATLDELAEVASKLAAGRPATLPEGFDAGRIRSWLPRLSSAETSALRGTTMYNNILVDLRKSAAARIRLMEMASLLKEGGSRVDKRTTEQIVLEAIAEAQQIHNSIDGGFQDLIRAGNTAAMRDLQPVKTGLLSACVDLKGALDKEVLGKEAEAASPRPPVVPKSPTKYTTDPAAKSDKAKDPVSKEKGLAPRTSSGSVKKIGLAVTLVALAAGAARSNLPAFQAADSPRVFRPEDVLFETNGVRVWMSTVNTADESITYIVDGTWALASEEQREAAMTDLAARSAGRKRMIVLDYRNQQVAERDL